MPIDYEAMRAAAERLIGENGGEITYEIVKGGETSYDPATGQIVTTGGTSEIVTHKGVLTRYNSQEGFVSDSTVLKDAQKVVIAGEVFRSVGDTLMIDNTEYRIVYKNETKPDTSVKIVTTMVVSL